MKYLLILFYTIYLFADSNFVGLWQSKNGKFKMRLNSDMTCILKIKNKIVSSKEQCKWDIKEKVVYFKYAGKEDKFYFRLDRNELLLEQDKRSLNRKKADYIMHKIYK